MKQTALSIAASLDALAEWTGRAVSWLALILTVVTVYDAGVRYLFHSGSVGMQELEWHLYALLFLLAAAYTLKHNDHVRVDVFYARLSVRGQAIVDTLGAFLLLIPFCILIIYTSYGFVESSWRVGEGSGDPGGLPARYLIKGMIPFGFGLLLLQGVSEAIKSALRIIDPEQAPSPVHDVTTDGV